MGKNLGIFILSFVLFFGGGYFILQDGGSKDQQTASDPAKQEASQADKPEAAATETASSSSEGDIFVTRGCSSCHAVSSLGVEGGATGPDLSQAYVNVADKHGVPMEEFLKNPTSAVMSSVLGGNPLTDDEREAVLNALKVASEK